jgi:hypothetical protein
MTPLEIFVGLWQQKVTSVPYVETVNQPVDTNDLPNEWGAVIYQPQASADVSLGSNPWVEESGTFLIGLFTRSGKGPAALDAAVAEVRAAFHGAALNGLWVDKVDGPHDLDPQADGEWWRVALTANYIFQTRRSATGPVYGDWEGFDTPAPPPP